MAQYSLSQKLHLIEKACRRRKFFCHIAMSFLFAGCLCLISGLWEHFFGLQESSALTISAVVLFLLIDLLFFCCFLYRKDPGAKEFTKAAVAVENAHPELRDSYIAAIELERKQSLEELRPMEKLLLSKMQQKYGDDSLFLSGVFAAQLSWRGTFSKFLWAALVWIIVLCSSTILPKAYFALQDFCRGVRSGIQIQSSPREFPIHSDVRIAANIVRWEKKAEIEVRNIAGVQSRLLMTNSQTGASVFTFYDMTELQSFRICTPSLKSEWHEIGIYVPPEFKKLKLRARAPAYTKKNVQTWDEMQDIEVVSGTELSLEFETPDDVSATLKKNDKVLKRSPESPHTFFSLLHEKASFALSLQDAAGHSANYKSFNVTVIPDLPPVIEVQEPAPDSVVKLGDSVYPHLFVGDDFGVSKVRFRFLISGSPWHEIVLFESDAGKEKLEEEITAVLDLSKYNVKDGDLLSCFFEAYDNCVPDKQCARSEIFFLTIRPNKDSLEKDASQGQSSQSLAFDVSDLIAENKRLMRLSLDSMNALEKDWKRNQFELQRDLRELALDVKRKLNKLKEMAHGQIGTKLPEVFGQSSTALDQAANLVDKRLFEESLSFEELSLTKLIWIENELIKNSMKQQQGQGKDSKQSQSQQQEQQGQKQQQNAQEQAREKRKEMEKILKQIRNLTNLQQEHNDHCSQRNALPEKLAADQQNLEAQNKTLEDQLKSIAECARCVPGMHSAGEEMHYGTAALLESNPRVGGIHGQRAQGYLQAVIRDLENAIRKESANQIEKLAEIAGRLSDIQRAESQKSGSMSSGASAAEAKAARERQKQLSSITKKFKQEINDTAESLRDDYPEVAKELAKSVADSSHRGLEKEQKKAENALLYKRFNSAEKAQQTAANLLLGLAQGLHGSSSKMPPMSSEELLEALEQLQKKADQIAQAMKDSDEKSAKEQVGQQKDSAGKMLQNLAEKLHDRQLMELSDALQNSDPEKESSEGAGRAALQVMKKSAAVLMHYLQNMNLKQKVELNRAQVLPPEKYRHQVQEYFKNLGHEE